MKTSKEEEIPEPSLKKDEIFEGVKITSDGEKHGKFILYKGKYVNKYGTVDIQEINPYSSSDYENILGILNQY